MPTGYTYPVKDGEVTTLRAFTLLCARAFGATISMRDDPMDKAIPDKFSPDTKFYDGQIEEYKKELAELEALTSEQADTMASADHIKNIRYWEESNAKNAVEAVRYDDMTKKVQAWRPAGDYLKLKEFMLQQLTESYRFDINEPHHIPAAPEKDSGEVWKTNRIAEVIRSMGYAVKSRAEEIERTESRNKWIAGLRESLIGIE